MKLDGLRKNEQALEELRVKGLTAEASERKRAPGAHRLIEPRITDRSGVSAPSSE
jgi:hypothetical protein